MIGRLVKPRKCKLMLPDDSEARWDSSLALQLCIPSQSKDPDLCLSPHSASDMNRSKTNLLPYIFSGMASPKAGLPHE
jgi:hypothetical protein